MKTLTKTEVKNFIKANGKEMLDGTVEATINGKRFGYCGNIIVSLDTYRKFPPFREVEIYDELLIFYYGKKSYTFDNEDRRDRSIDAYWTLIEAAMAK